MARAAPTRTPTFVAIERLAKMASAGGNARKMVTALDAILISWGAEELPPDDLRERIETLQSDLDSGAQAAEDYVAEADSDKARAAAQAQLEALIAARERLAAVVAG